MIEKREISSVTCLMVFSPGDKLIDFKKCLISLLLQSRPIEEIIVVCNGGTFAEVKKVITKTTESKKINLIDEKSFLHLGPALNLGLEYITSEYILRADPDDISMSNRVEILLETVYGNKFDVIGSFMAAFCEKTSLFLPMIYPVNQTSIKRRMFFSNAMGHPSVLYRTEIVKKLNGYRDLELAEDYDLWLRLLNEGAQFVNIDKFLVLYRVKNTPQTKKTHGYFLNKILLKQQLLRLNLLYFIFLHLCARTMKNWLYSLFSLSPYWLKKVARKYKRNMFAEIYNNTNFDTKLYKNHLSLINSMISQTD
jgi:glycosyltransferase involved in cell wall biosynthesis